MVDATKEMRTTLAARIRGLIRDFEADTGLEVVSVDLRRAPTFTYRGSGDLVGVELRVEVP